MSQLIHKILLLMSLTKVGLKEASDLDPKIVKIEFLHHFYIFYPIKINYV